MDDFYEQYRAEWTKRVADHYLNGAIRLCPTCQGAPIDRCECAFRSWVVNTKQCARNNEQASAAHSPFMASFRSLYIDARKKNLASAVSLMETVMTEKARECRSAFTINFGEVRWQFGDLKCEEILLAFLGKHPGMAVACKLNKDAQSISVQVPVPK